MYFPGDRDRVDSSNQGSQSSLDRIARRRNLFLRHSPQTKINEVSSPSERASPRRGDSRDRRETSPSSSPRFPSPRLNIGGQLRYGDNRESGFPSLRIQPHSLDHETGGSSSPRETNDSRGMYDTEQGANNTSNSDIPQQPVVFYTPVVPPSSVKQTAWRRNMHLNDGFQKPLETSGSAEQMRTGVVCTICRFSVLGTGDIMQTIMKIYNDNIGFINVVHVYRAILSYWNKYVAGQFVILDDSDEHDSETSRGSEKRKRRDKESEVDGEEEDEDDGDEEASESEDEDSNLSSGDDDVDDEEEEEHVERMNIDESSRGSGEEVELSESDDSDGFETSSSERELESDSDSESESDEEESNLCRIPRIKTSEIDYHFTHCYREQNGQRLIFEQMHKLLEIQEVIFQNGVFCKRSKVSSSSSAGSSGCIPPVDTESIHMAQRVLSEMASTIQQETMHLVQLKEEIEKYQKPRRKKLRKTERKIIHGLASTIAEKETNLQTVMIRYENLNKELKELETRRTMSRNGGSGVNGFNETSDICVKMREVMLVQSLGKTIISLLDKMANYQKRQGQVPFGQTTEEYYRSVPLMNHHATANDKSVIRRRRDDFVSQNGFLTPGLLSMAQKICNSKDPLGSSSNLFREESQSHGSHASIPSTSFLGQGKESTSRSTQRSSNISKKKSRLDID